MAKQKENRPKTAQPSGERHNAEVPPDTLAKSREIVKRLPAIGYVTWLCSQSPSQRHLFIQDLEWRMFPAIVLGQYKLHTDSKVGGLPTAFASWAFLSARTEASYRATHKLRPGDWRSGDRLWLIDFITPFGGAPALLDELYYQIHKDREIKLLYPDGNGTPVETTLSALMRQQSANRATTTEAPDGSTRH